MEDIREEVLSFIEKRFNVEKEFIKDDTALMDLGSIYSVGIISMISFIEDTYNLIVEDEDITLENFGTVNSIVEYVKTHCE